MEVESQNQIPQGGNGHAVESTPGPSPGCLIVSGGGTPLHRGGADVSTAGPSRDHVIMSGSKKTPARGRRGRCTRPYTTSMYTGESGSEASDVSVVSAALINPDLTTRGKRKSRTADTELVAAKFLALPASDLETEKANTEEDLFSKPKTINTRPRKNTRRSAIDTNVERLEKENAELRSQVSSLTSKLEKLTEEIKFLRESSSIIGDARNVVEASPHISNVAPSTGGTELMERIKDLIETKLMEFEAKLFPDRAIRPPLSAGKCSNGNKESNIPKSQEKWNQTKKGGPQSRSGRGKRPLHPPIADLPPVKFVQPDEVPHAGDETWATVTKKANQSKSALVPQKRRTNNVTRVPTSAAVTVTLPEGSSLTYAKIMELAKSKIRLSDIGIESLRQKRALTGGLLMEINGADCTQKADKLAEKMREIFSDTNIRINRPNKMGDIRIKDLDDSISPREVAEAVAEAGGCLVDDIKVGDIRRTPLTMGTCWLRCPIKAVRELATAGRIRVGWGSVRVEALEPRPLHCFRCLEKGHVGSKCQNQANRSGRCYACGETGHKAKECTTTKLKCPLCSDLGRPSDHRYGKRCGTLADKRLTKEQKLCDVEDTVHVAAPIQSSTADGITTPSLSAGVEAMEAYPSPH